MRYLNTKLLLLFTSVHERLQLNPLGQSMKLYNHHKSTSSKISSSKTTVEL